MEIMIGDIIKKNTCIIEVYGYYGTETGKKAIESSLQEQGIKGGYCNLRKRNCKPCVSSYQRNEMYLA